MYIVINTYTHILIIILVIVVDSKRVFNTSPNLSVRVSEESFAYVVNRRILCVNHSCK